ncbi:MAG TPA: TOMM precursor leader peptide-binding protein [Nitrospiraceae bacterium]|nr:TOMM precursor leader peptide-binding protein [Nitrospiraceae bacterium]
MEGACTLTILKQNSKFLTALPVQVIEVPGGVVLKRGATEILVNGAHAAEVVKSVLNLTGNGASVARILGRFSPSDRQKIQELINHLIERHMLVSADTKMRTPRLEERDVDIFFSNFGSANTGVVTDISKLRFVIIGVNTISRQLALCLATCGFQNYLVLDDLQHRSPRFFNKMGDLNGQEWPASLERPRLWDTNRPLEFGDCTVVTSDAGGQQYFCELNKLCLEHKVKLLPVMLKNFIGHVGPFVIPGETACYQCLVSREGSHRTDPLIDSIVDTAAVSGNAVGFHPSMAAILGDVAAFELTRFFTGNLPQRAPGQFLEIDLLAGKMVNRTVIKVPRCTACGSLQKSSLINLRKLLFSRNGSK